MKVTWWWWGDACTYIHSRHLQSPFSHADCSFLQPRHKWGLYLCWENDHNHYWAVSSRKTRSVCHTLRMLAVDPEHTLFQLSHHSKPVVFVFFLLCSSTNRFGLFWQSMVSYLACDVTWHHTLVYASSSILIVDTRSRMTQLWVTGVTWCMRLNFTLCMTSPCANWSLILGVFEALYRLQFSIDRRICRWVPIWLFLTCTWFLL